MHNSIVTKDTVIVPAHFIPTYNVQRAFHDKTEDNVLLVTWGGLGDQVCAEPTIRYCLENFKNKKFTLASEQPELYEHLTFHEVIDLRKYQPVYKNYYTIFTIYDPSHLMWQFFSHAITHCVDYCSLAMLRCQLPIASKDVCLPRFAKDRMEDVDLDSNHVVIHAGKHWPSKTFPKEFWDSIVKALVEAGITPILIGKDCDPRTDDKIGIVDVEAIEGVVDLRNKTTIKQLVWLLTNCKVLVSNDSSPIHIASASDAYIGMIATCKHPEYITHYRYNRFINKNQFGWRTTNLGHDGIWNHMSIFPTTKEEVTVEFLPDGLLEKILPTPVEVVEYVRGSLTNYYNASGCVSDYMH